MTRVRPIGLERKSTRKGFETVPHICSSCQGGLRGVLSCGRESKGSGSTEYHTCAHLQPGLWAHSCHTAASPQGCEPCLVHQTLAYALTLLLDEHQQRSLLHIWLHICYNPGCLNLGNIFSLALDEASLGDERKRGRVPGWFRMVP